MKSKKILGCMIGLAVGDALGVPVEFMGREEIRETYGILDKMVGGGTWGQEPGTTSDDTAMALAVAEGIVKNPAYPVPSVGDGFIKWYKGRPFDVGICCSMVIQSVENLWHVNEADWFFASRRYDESSGGRSGGNGGLMRTAYVGCYYNDVRDVESVAWDVCGMTHWNESARKDCQLVSRIIHDLINGGNKKTIEDIILERNEYANRFPLGEIEGYPFTVQPSGSSKNSLACALKSVLTTNSFRDAVVMAVNMGGDADTIGAITGAIAGALYGVDEIPEEWVASLEVKVFDRIINVCSKATISRVGGDVGGLCVGNESEADKGEVPTGNDNPVGC